ncbi:MAG TPA: hypothetical protein VGL99_26665 [Chloroflexota bacterium]|jgi:hypothetical protein
MRLADELIRLDRHALADSETQLAAEVDELARRIGDHGVVAVAYWTFSKHRARAWPRARCGSRRPTPSATWPHNR